MGKAENNGDAEETGIWLRRISEIEQVGMTGRVEGRSAISNSHEAHLSSIVFEDSLTC
jgi:hypothetical protein